LKKYQGLGARASSIFRGSIHHYWAVSTKQPK
jgi:hypothetical protein